MTSEPESQFDAKPARASSAFLSADAGCFEFNEPIRALAVEADPEKSAELRGILEASGFEASLFDSVDAAWAKIEAIRPDVVIAPISKAGGGSGYDLFRKIKADPEKRFIQTIAAIEDGAAASMSENALKKADDCVGLPHRNKELGVRIRLLARCARLQKTFQSRAKLMNALVEIAAVASETLDRKKMAEGALAAILQKVGFDAGWICVFGPDMRLDCAAALGLPAKIVNDPFIAELNKRSSIGRIQDVDRARIYEAMLNMQGAVTAEGRPAEQIETLLIVPLQAVRGVIGALGLVSFDKARAAFPADEFFAALAGQLAMSVDNSLLYADAEESRRRYKFMHAEAQSGNKALKETMRQLQDTHAQLIQSEKLSSLGELVSGMAHELNNPLTGVLGYVQLLLARQDLTDDAARDLERIDREAQRCHRIVQNLLAFARGRKPSLEMVSISTLLGDTLDLMAHRLRSSGVEVERSFEPNLPMTVADPFQIKQVFMSLINNACSAITDAAASPGRLEIRLFRRVGAIFAEFQDNGAGIKPENFQKLFDPFYTTRGVGKGAGLGLSLSYGIMKEHGGNIYVDSKIGEGSTFTVEVAVQKVADGLMESNEVDRPGRSLDRVRVLLCGLPETEAARIEKIVKSAGGDSAVANDVESAYLAVNDQKCDAVICASRFGQGSVKSFWIRLCGSHPTLARRMAAFLGGDEGDGDLEACLSSAMETIKEGAPEQAVVAAILRMLEKGKITREEGRPIFMARHKKILVVDDEEHIRRVLQAILGEEGYNVSCAANGEEALALAHREAPDLVLIDLSMPGMDGTEVCQRLRMDDATEKIPIFMLTGKMRLEDKMASFQQGASRYICKPFNPRDLIEEINRFFEAKQYDILINEP